MPIYHTLGTVPRKRHTAFRKPNGGIYAEELMGHEGFTGTSSLLYHVHPPTTVRSVKRIKETAFQEDPDSTLKHRHFRTARARTGGSPTLDRIPLMFNADIAMLYVEPDEEDAHFYRNAQADELSDARLLVKQYDGINELILDHHPFDVIGWDGYFYPWAFNIRDFEPIVGRVHQPPPVHQTFEGDGFVVCSFCPRPYDFDPNAVPAPYNHSNVDSDEVLYYASSEFMSRKGIEFGSITHHPDGIPHGPHPGRAEASIGAKETNELAVMMDSFRPLTVAKQATAIEDPNYHKSWLQGQHAQFNPPTS